MAQHDYVIANGSGAAVRADINNMAAAIVSDNSGASAPSITYAFMRWMDTANNLLKTRDAANSNWVNTHSLVGTTLIPYSEGVPLNMTEVTLNPDDATPSVSGGVSFKTANTAPTTYTALDDAKTGQEVTIRCNDANTTLDGALTATGMTIPLVSGDTWTGVYDGSGWKQTGGTVGMGRRVEIGTDPVQVTDWPASTVTTYAGGQVDVTKDGVRKGASAVGIRPILNSTATLASLRVRKKGSAADTVGMIVAQPQNTTVAAADTGEFTVNLNNDGIFEAKFSASWTASTNEGWINHYYI